MAFDGGPPIYDRIIVRRRMAAAAIVVGAVIVAGVLTLSRSLGDTSPEEVEYRAVGSVVRDEARELEDAYEAAQRFVLGEIRMARVEEVSWGPRMHAGHMGWYRFEGPLEVKDKKGNSYRFRYLCAVSLPPRGSWKLEEVTVREDETAAE